MHSQELADYIGGESCVDLKPDVDNDNRSSSRPTNRPRRRHVAPEKECPPPIPWRWSVKRHSTSDGRLVVMMEKVKQREYFQAHRSDGRLLLSLVPEEIDDVGGVDPTVEQELSDCDEYCRYNEVGVNPCGFQVPVAAAPVQT